MQKIWLILRKKSTFSQNTVEKTGIIFRQQPSTNPSSYISTISKKDIFYTAIPGLSNKRFRLWFAPLSQSNLIRYAAIDGVAFVLPKKTSPDPTSLYTDYIPGTPPL